MKLGLLQFELLIHDASSLKDKRRVVRSTRDRLRRSHNVSVCELGLRDQQSAASMGVVTIARDMPSVSRVMDRIISDLRRPADFELGDVRREVMDSLDTPWTDERGDPLWTEDERRDAGGEL